VTATGDLKPGCGSQNLKGLMSQELRRQGKSPSEITRIIAGTRASMNGQVPGNLTYNAWLRRQPRAFIDEVLGPTKARLYLDGRLHLDRFIDLDTGKPFTLQELRRRYEAAWMRAGLGEAT